MAGEINFMPDMAKGLPQENGSVDTNNISTDVNSPTIPLDEAVQPELQQPASANLVRFNQPKAGYGDALSAGLHQSILSSLIEKISEPHFEADKRFSSYQAYMQDKDTRNMKLDNKSLEYLGESNSAGQYQYRLQRVLREQQYLSQMSQHPLVGFGGAILGDAPLAAISLGMGAIGESAEAAFYSRMLSNSIDYAATAYTSDDLTQSDMNLVLATPLVGLDMVFGISSKLGKSVLRSKQAVEEPVEDVAEELAKDEHVGAAFSEETPETVERLKKDGVISSYKIHGTKLADDGTLEIDPDAPYSKAHYNMKPKKVSATGRGYFKAPVKDIYDHLMKSDKIGKATKLLLKSAYENGADTVNVRIGLATEKPSYYDKLGHVIHLRAPQGAAGKTWGSYVDAINDFDQDIGSTFTHEMLHAATSRRIDNIIQGKETSTRAINAFKRLEEIRNDLLKDKQYYSSYPISSPYEFVAALANDPLFIKTLRERPSKWVKGKTVLRDITRNLLDLLGIKPKKTQYEDVVNAYSDLLEHGSYKNPYGSVFMRYLFEDSKGDPVKMADSMKKYTARTFAVSDQLKQGGKAGEEVSRRLVADPTSTKARDLSVTDIKRDLMSEASNYGYAIEKAIEDHVTKYKGVTFADKALHRSKFNAAVREVSEELTYYLHTAHDALVAGTEIPKVPEGLEDLVKAYGESNWSKFWRDKLVESGIIDDPDAIVESPYYLPREYSYNKVRELLNSGYKEKDLRNMFRQAIGDTYPYLSKDTRAKLATQIVDNTIGIGQRGGFRWQNLIQDVSGHQLEFLMREAGIDNREIQKFLENTKMLRAKEGTTKNLRKRGNFDIFKTYELPKGKTLSLKDLIETDVIKLVSGYDRRISGKVAFKMEGTTLSKYKELIDKAKLSAPDPDKYQKVADDVMNTLLGAHVGGDMPELLRAASDLSRASMLSLSGLWQVVDSVFAMKEVGMSRTFKAIAQGGLFRHIKAATANPELADRMQKVFSDFYNTDLKFRYIRSYAEDNADLTRSSQAMNVIRNLGQAGKYVNGLAAVIRMQTKLNSGLVADSLSTVINGDINMFNLLRMSRVTTEDGAVRLLAKEGVSADMARKHWAVVKEANFLKRFGLSEDDALALMEQKPESGLYPPELQRKLEGVGTRFMDYTLQNIRTGETSHFAEFNPIGKLVIGYNSFTVAMTNKVLRRYVQNGEYGSLALVMGMQFALMIPMTMARYAASGSLKKHSSQELILDSLMGMSALGAVSLLSPLFTGESPSGDISALAGVIQGMKAIKAYANKNDKTSADAVKTAMKTIPLVNEFYPLKAAINNLGN